MHVSSIAAYGANEFGSQFLDESFPDRPITHYGYSKSEGDARLRSLAQNSSSRLIILRPGVFYGTRPSKNLHELFEKLKKSPMPIFTQHGFLRTYADIDSVVDALLASETKGTSGEIYCIGDHTPIGTLSFYRSLTDALNTKLKVVAVPVLIARLAEAAAWWAGKVGIHLRIPTVIGEFGRHTFVSSRKAEQELKVSLPESPKEGLVRMVRSVAN